MIGVAARSASSRGRCVTDAAQRVAATAPRTDPRLASSPTAATAAAAARARTSGARTVRPPSDRAPWRSSRAPRCDRGRRGRRPGPAVWRRREIPRGGATSRTTPPTGAWLGPRRRTKRSPGASAIGAASRTIPAAVPSGRSRASRPARPTAASTAAVPACSRARVRSATGRRNVTSARSVARTGRIGRQHHAAVELVDPDPGEVERRPSAALDALDGRPVDLDLADPHVAVAGHEPEGVAARQRPAAERAR